jgi:valyl-tRNA synthetase
LFNQIVSIIADISADPEKGTGAMMICSYGDRYDVEAINKLRLKPRICITKDGRLNELAGEYADLSVKDARKTIINDLEKNNFLINKKSIKHIVNVHDKCGTEIEFLTSKQWFIKILENKKKFIDAGKKIKWYPSSMLTRYINWVKGIQWDWCISRQRHFGVPFPVWVCDKCNEIVLASEDKLPVDPLNNKFKCKCNGTLIGEKDVMDTWATSSLTPQIALNWAEKDNKMNLFPMSLRPQAHDIIRTWAFYTIIKSIYHHNSIPWNNIIISGFVTLEGKKMSKSKGNVILPQEILEKFGADPLRFCAASSKLGEDLAYSEKDLFTGKRTAIKLWNASKFVLINSKDYKKEIPSKLELIDSWLLSKLNILIKNCNENFNKYEYSKAKLETENFFWNVFCDYYLEIVKDRLYNENLRGKNAKISAQYTLNFALLNILKLFAPIMPYITEEIYHLNYSKKENKKSIHLSDFPEYKKDFANKKAEKIGDEIISLISKVRQFKSKYNKSLKEQIEITLEKSKRQILKHVLADFKAVVNAKNINFGKKFEIKF